MNFTLLRWIFDMLSIATAPGFGFTMANGDSPAAGECLDVNERRYGDRSMLVRCPLSQDASQLIEKYTLEHESLLIMQLTFRG